MRQKHERGIRFLPVLSALMLLSLYHSWMAVAAQAPVVRAVLFYSPTCGHCHYVITEILPPLFEEHGEQLQIIGIDASTSTGQYLYQETIDQFNISTERQGVPCLVLGETVLVGSIEIPEQLPALIEQYLADGGVDWPDIPGLAELMQASAEAATAEATPEATAEQTALAEPTAAVEPTPESTAAPEPISDTIVPASGMVSMTDPTSDDLLGRLRRDPEGNAVAILVLVGMLAVIGFALGRLRWIWKTPQDATMLEGSSKGWRFWAAAALCLVGLGVSFYMAYVETTDTTAVCGPIGDCNTVQQSPYAVLFGFLPLGVFGILGYAAMLTVLAGTRWGRGQLKRLSEAALLGMALFGTLFSIYLTFLEPFVIGATCAWCLTSAVCMTLILVVQVGAVPANPEPTRHEAQAEAVS